MRRTSTDLDTILQEPVPIAPILHQPIHTAEHIRNPTGGPILSHDCHIFNLFCYRVLHATKILSDPRSLGRAPDPRVVFTNVHLDLFYQV